ncbi:MAG TPA: PDZ domain-containing protein [Vicinamibacterales bacterium]|nr:PDZ domain-containing protein [Vicinamibacterales bacterium]
MKKLFGRAGASAAAAAVLSAVVTAALMMAVRPADAQEPRVVLRSFGFASIGVSIRDVTGEDAVKAKMAQPAGVYVETVTEGSPASKAGLQAGDIVVDFDGERVRSASHFTRLVQESVPNRQLAAVVVRGTSKQTLTVVPQAGGNFNVLSNDTRRRFEDLQRQLPGDLNLRLDDAFRRGVTLNGRNLGVTVSPLSDQLASHFGVKQGVLVSTVVSNSPAAAAGVQAGDVITAVNGQSVSSSADITRALRETSGDSVAIAVTRDRKSLSLKATLPARTTRPSGRGGLPV